MTKRRAKHVHRGEHGPKTFYSKEPNVTDERPPTPEEQMNKSMDAVKQGEDDFESFDKPTPPVAGPIQATPVLGAMPPIVPAPVAPPAPPVVPIAAPAPPIAAPAAPPAPARGCVHARPRPSARPACAI